ncbi:type II toxin-antitoxin system VapC family toxin [Conchiformibius steedae]|uniref:PIN domain-containing protein n=1 Tax=Conchiformibius steedae TaxID=153493 RepID=A0A3P2A4Q2_9NEIS|nr:PIN domain-containing protein [Conchiformibius steedae]RRD90329.1 PIN domain-containing protein [Conchiformibius steedae]
MSRYLLDSNYLIALEDSSHSKHQDVLSDMTGKLQNTQTVFFITPLIRYEFLRGLDWVSNGRLNQAEQILSGFDLLEINKEISDLARDLYRFDKFESQQNHQNRNLEKNKFDMFHFATAQIHGLEILSNDTDIKKIDDLYRRMQQF